MTSSKRYARLVELAQQIAELEWLRGHEYLRRADGTRRLHVFRDRPVALEAMLFGYYRPHTGADAMERARFWLGEAWQPWGIAP